VSHVDYLAMKTATGKVLDLWLLHPWQVCATHVLLVARVKEAIVALNEFLVTLEKVHHLITKLRHVELSWLRLMQMVFDNAFADSI
jgi:hypothetical protein